MHASFGRTHLPRHDISARVVLTALALLLAACGGSASTPVAATGGAAMPVEQRVAALLSQMTLDEKIGQMTQIEICCTDQAGVKAGLLGSVLSGGDGNPKGENNAANWYGMVEWFQQGALGTRLAIPILYGVDAVHGDAHLKGTTVFPHNIGLGASHDAPLVERTCQVTAAEMNVTGVRWAFAPMVTVPLDTLRLPAGDVALVAKMRPLVKKLVVVVMSGRPVMLDGVAGGADALVAAWLPGTEDEGLADVLLGKQPFIGTTPYTWPLTPADAPRAGKAACQGALYPYGYGLDAAGSLLGPAAC